MSKLRLGINGMGRIGRTVLRELLRRQQNNELKDVEIVAVNNPGDKASYVHLLKYDSVHREFPGDVRAEGEDLLVNNQLIKFYGEKDPTQIPWSNSKVDIVIDATGIFKDKKGLGQHLNGTVKKVIMCAPGKDLDATFVFGVNHKEYNKDEHHIVSNASCTTNCLAPIAKILHETFGITHGFMTTIHAYTSDQSLLDGSHSDFRRARAAAMSMIPTTTGAAKAVGLVFPELKGKLDGYAIRVPTPDVSVVDLTVTLEKAATVESINKAMKTASEGALKGVLQYEEAPLVSIDFTGNSHSSIFDSQLTNVIANQAKVVSWYDNEVGFSNRVLDLANHMGQNL